MLFSPDQAKQVQEVIFSRKTKINRKLSLYFDNALVEQTPV